MGRVSPRSCGRSRSISYAASDWIRDAETESCKCDESMETNTVNWCPFRESVSIYGTTEKLHRFSAFDSSINLLNFELPW